MKTSTAHSSQQRISSIEVAIAASLDVVQDDRDALRAPLARGRVEHGPVVSGSDLSPISPLSSPGDTVTPMTVTLTLERLLGRGATSKVHTGHIDDFEVALKIVSPSVGWMEDASHMQVASEAAIYHHWRDIQGVHVPCCGGLWKSPTRP